MKFNTKPGYIIALLLLSITFVAKAQETVGLNDLRAYVGKKVTVKMPALGFDVRHDYIYLYLGGWYPDQRITIVVKRINDGKTIKLNKEVIVGKKISAFTGYVSIYDGSPDSTTNFDDDAIKKEFEKPEPIVIFSINKHGTMRKLYQPRKEPVDLRGKLVLFITDNKQIGRPFTPEPPSPDDFPTVIPDH